MKKPTFTDRAGCTWTFQDFRVADDGPQPVELNHQSGEYRAFADALPWITLRVHTRGVQA